MIQLRPSARQTLVGDFETEYDEFDLDGDLEQSLHHGGRLEPSW